MDWLLVLDLGSHEIIFGKCSNETEARRVMDYCNKALDVKNVGYVFIKAVN
jgi:hypothetical protein